MSLEIVPVCNRCNMHTHREYYFLNGVLQPVWICRSKKHLYPVMYVMVEGDAEPKEKINV